MAVLSDRLAEYAYFQDLDDMKIIKQYVKEFSCIGKDGRKYEFALLVRYATGAGRVSLLPFGLEDKCEREEKKGEFLCMDLRYCDVRGHMFTRPSIIYAHFFRKSKSEDWQITDESDIKHDGLEIADRDPGFQVYSVVYSKFEAEARRHGVKELKIGLWLPADWEDHVNALRRAKGLEPRPASQERKDDIDKRNRFFQLMGFQFIYKPNGWGYAYKKLIE